MFDEICLSDAVEFIVDNRGKTVPVQERGFPLIATNCISNENLYPEFSNVRYVSDEVYESWFRAHPEPDDIILTNKGSKNGAICLVPDPVGFCIAQDMVALRAKKGFVYPRYLFAALRSSLVQNRIKELNVDSVIPHFKKTDFNKLFFPLPDYDRQIVIGDCYYNYCQKIQLNRQTNQTLEHIAQAIFKSWFVDFEPTRAKIAAKQEWLKTNPATNKPQSTRAAHGAGTGDNNAPFSPGSPGAQFVERAAIAAISGLSITDAAGAPSDQIEQLSPEQQAQLKATAALFPDALVESELGEIPEGWEVKVFGDVSQCFDSKRIPLSKKKREEKKPGNIPYYGATSVMDYVNEWIFDDIYLLLGEDGSVIKEDGTPFVQYIWGKAWVNNHAHVLQGKNGVSTEQLMIFIQNQNIAAYITGAVQLKLNQGNMNSIPFLDAGDKTNAAFYELVSPLYQKIRKTIESNATLSELRDVLLPKLLSGELSTTPTQTELEAAV